MEGGGNSYSSLLMLTRPQLHRFLISLCLTLIDTVGMILALLKLASVGGEAYCLLAHTLRSITSTYSAVQAQTLSSFVFQCSCLNLSHIV